VAKLGELARLVRSKNAGPFLLTFDIMFDNRETYEAVKRARVLTPALIAKTYGIPEEHVRFIEYDPGLAFKATIPRPVPSGDPFDTDVYGAQQHAPLVDLEVPVAATRPGRRGA
jgi:hypothetical protein